MDISLKETSLDKPVGSSGSENKQFFTSLRPRLGFNTLEQCIATPRATIIRMHRETGKLARLIVGKRIERGATGYHSIVFDHYEAADFHLHNSRFRRTSVPSASRGPIN